MCNTAQAVDRLGQLREYVELDNTKNELEDKLKIVTSRMKALDSVIMEHMQASGIKSFTMLGRTVYVERRLWASATDIDALALFADTAEFVRPRVLAQTISAYVRELPVDDEGMPVLPTQIKDAVNVTEKFSVRTRKA